MDTNIYILRNIVYYYLNLQAILYISDSKNINIQHKYKKIIIIIITSFVLEAVVSDLFFISQLSKFIFFIITYKCLVNNKRQFDYKLINIIIFSDIIKETVDMIINISFRHIFKNEYITFNEGFLELLVISLIFIVCIYYITPYYKQITEDTGLGPAIMGVLIAFTLFLTFNNLVINATDQLYNYPLLSLFLFSQLGLAGVLYFFLNKIYNRQINKKKIEMLEKYTQDLENSHLKLRKFKHDYKNLLLLIDSLLKEQKYSQAQLYLKELNDYSTDEMMSTVSSYSDIDNIKHDQFKYLLLEKIFKMIKEDILFHFECKQQMSKFNINDFDAVRLIGILLDNAIEATLEIEKKQVNIVVNQVDETLEITIENTYEVDQLSHVEMLYQPEYTTKSGHDGLGLTIVDQMSNLHHNLFVQYHPTDYFFTVVVIIT